MEQKGETEHADMENLVSDMEQMTTAVMTDSPPLASEINVLDLPLEVITRILSFLPYGDFLTVRLTCSRLYVASLAPELLSREIVVFNKRYYSLEPANLLKSKRDFHHFTFMNEKPFTYTLEVWSNFGPKLKSLTFANCTLSENDLFAVLSHCTSLKHFGISSCVLNISSSTRSKPCGHEETAFGVIGFPLLDNLENLTVQSLFDPRVFVRILSCAPNLKSLSVGELEFERTSGSSLVPLTCDDVFPYLKVCGHRLTQLSLVAGIAFTYDPDFETKRCALSTAFSKIQNLQLKSFSNNFLVCDDFLKIQRMCEVLRLFDVTSGTVDVICQELGNLKQLEIYSPFLSRADLTKISSLRNLISLTIAYNPPEMEGDNDIYEGLCGEVNTRLRRLDLSIGPTNTTYKLSGIAECVVRVGQTYPALTHLSLCNFRNGITNVTVQAIFQHLVLLKCLKITHALGLSDYGLRGEMGPGEENTLVHLNCSTGYSIARLQRLCKLDLSDCECFTGDAFTDERMKFPELQKVRLGSLDQMIADDALIALVENNPTIEEMIFPYNLVFTDRLVEAILRMKRLQRIILGGNKLNVCTAENGERLIKHCRIIIMGGGYR